MRDWRKPAAILGAAAHEPVVVFGSECNKGMAVVARNDAPQAVREAIELFSPSAGEIIAIGKASETSSCWSDREIRARWACHRPRPASASKCGCPRPRTGTIGFT